MCLGDAHKIGLREACQRAAALTDQAADDGGDAMVAAERLAVRARQAPGRVEVIRGGGVRPRSMEGRRAAGFGGSSDLREGGVFGAKGGHLFGGKPRKKTSKSFSRMDLIGQEIRDCKEMTVHCNEYSVRGAEYSVRSRRN